MKSHRFLTTACITVAVVVLAPGGAAGTLTAVASEVAQPEYTEADVRFMQGMIVHHAQALEMTALVPTRSERAEVQLLARRITVAQDDEMALMRAWLAARDEPVEPAPSRASQGGHGQPGHHLMPGMLDAAALERLAAADGDEFDRLLLEYMIRHHEGALEMVAELFAVDGAGQEPEIFQFATHVDSDQRIEIARMRTLLESINNRGRE